MSLRLDKIPEALHDTNGWARMNRRVRELTDAELAEADRVERLSKRRTNMLAALKAEQQRRAGCAGKMRQVKVETRT